MNNPPGGGHLGTGRLLAFGALGFPAAALTLPLYVYLPAFYAQELGLGLATVGGVLLVARLWDVVVDPLVGQWSDRTRSRFGRRRPWILAATPLAMLSIGFLFMPPAGVGALHLLAWTALLYLAWTMLILPYTAWAAELSADYHERSRIAAFRESFVILGTVGAAALPALHPGGTGDALALLAQMMMATLPVAVLLLAWVPERPAPPLRPGWRDGLAGLRRNRLFRRLLLAYLLNGFANGLPATLFVLFVTHVLGQPAAAGPLLLAYFVAGIAAVPFWLWWSRRVGKHRAWCHAMLWASAAFACAPALGDGDFWPFLAICILSGLSLGADLVLPAAMQADVVDIETARRGNRSAGLYFAAWGMATKLALAIAVGVAFPLLELAGFDARGGNAQPALLSLALLYGALPVACKLAAVALTWRYPLDAARHARLRHRIDARDRGSATHVSTNPADSPDPRPASIGGLHDDEAGRFRR